MDLENSKGLGDTQAVCRLGERLEDLASLGDRTKVAAMLGRLCEQLESFLVMDPNVDWPAADVHRMVGLSAMLGFSQVETTWRLVETAHPQKESRRGARVAAEAAVHFAKLWV